MAFRSRAATCVSALALVMPLCPAQNETATAAPCRRHNPVPILMYHVVAVAPPDAPYPNLFVSPERFRKQVSYLARHGYRGVTLDEVWAHWRHCEPLPRSLSSSPSMTASGAGVVSPFRCSNGADGWAR